MRLGFMDVTGRLVMAEPAIRPMTLDEFLRWDDGTDTRYELIGGFPLAMAPPADAHGMLAIRLGTRIENALMNRRPCAARSEAGVRLPERADTFFFADLAVSCAPPEAGIRHVKDPILLVEILSPSTERHDRRLKLPAYRRIESVQEILLIASDSRYAELHRRQGSQWITELLRGAEGVLSLASVGVEVSMTELYDGIALEDEQER
jgi:Uma2 family endonuclease